MATNKSTHSVTRFSKQDMQLQIRGGPIKVDKVLIAAKSAKIAKLLKEHPHKDLSTILKDLHIDQEIFEPVLRFSHGLEVILNPENVISVTCLAHFLGMTESHSPNNLLKKALTYFDLKILPSWNESVKALKSCEYILRQANCNGLVDACFKSLISKAIDNPRLLGEPISSLFIDKEDRKENENVYAPSAKRRLFDVDEGQREELAILSIEIYETLIGEMICGLVPVDYILGSIYRYAKVWVFSSSNRNCELFQRDVIEALERLLPKETKGLIPCSFLSDMLKSAIVMEANIDCKTGLEIRIGKQLENAMVKDLIIPAQGYANEVEYDVECVRRIMRHYYRNYNREDILGIISVAELIDGFLAEVASDVDLKPETFLLLADTSVSASVGIKRNSDGIYKAIDIYLKSHKCLTESEREEVCQVLDCHKLSARAREHAAQNERLPLRVVVQVLFVGQLHLRDTIVNDIGGDKDEEERVEMEKMGNKVMELEKECHMMKREIEKKEKKSVWEIEKKEKVSVWRAMKRKFGCSSRKMDEQNCHAKRKKVHPKN